ncbi:MAG: hypothetical protein Kow00121_66390 [Elainellaceae cyanobacterium]
MTIYFYVEREKPYGCFSNFSAHGFMLIDYYWGCGKDGSGKNKLGQILMEVREILRDGN